MNIIGLFWAFHDLSSVSGVIEKLKSLMTLKNNHKGSQVQLAHGHKYTYTPTNIWLNVPLQVGPHPDAFGIHQQASGIILVG